MICNKIITITIELFCSDLSDSDNCHVNCYNSWEFLSLKCIKISVKKPVSHEYNNYFGTNDLKISRKTPKLFRILLTLLP